MSREFDDCYNCPYCNYEEGPSGWFCDVPPDVYEYYQGLPCQELSPEFDPQSFLYNRLGEY